MAAISEIDDPGQAVADRACVADHPRSHVAVIIPTCNALRHWTALSTGLRLQTLPPKQVLIIDSSSTDGTPSLAAAQGYQVASIERCDFNHGGTRQSAIDLVPWASIVVFLTQDAVLAKPDSLDHLLAPFSDPTIAAVYGRQLPRPGAGPIETHARLFNYPATSELRTFASRKTLGIKAAFLSNSFAAYRVEALRAVGGFPADVIMAEDALVAGRLLMAGWKTGYVADAEVFHSHPYTIIEEFRRYFDTGVYHHRQAWLIEQFGKPSGEGMRFVLSELEFLAQRRPLLLPAAILRTFAKAIGYHLGLREAKLGRKWCRRLSLHKMFWDRA